MSLPIMIPEIILGLAFMVVFNAMGIRGNDLRLVLAHVTFCIPYVFLNVKSRLVGMDPAPVSYTHLDVYKRQRKYPRRFTAKVFRPRHIALRDW